MNTVSRPFTPFCLSSLFTILKSYPVEVCDSSFHLAFHYVIPVAPQATEVASAAKRALAQETPGRGDMLPPFEVRLCFYSL